MVTYKQFHFFENWKEFKKWYDTQNITREITAVHEHHTWKPDYSYFKGDMNPQIEPWENHDTLMENLDNYHELALKWRDSGHHIATFKDGVIATARDLNWAPASIYGNNTGAVCIENMGNFDRGHDMMTEAQKESVLGVTATILNRHELEPNTDTILYHHWFDQDTGKRTNGEWGNVKTCPSHNFFGGNKVKDCEENFIPLIKQKLKEMEEKQMKDYKEILKEKTDSPDVWIKLCDDLENGYIELENIQTLQWLKVLVEKLGN